MTSAVAGGLRSASARSLVPRRAVRLHIDLALLSLLALMTTGYRFIGTPNLIVAGAGWEVPGLVVLFCAAVLVVEQRLWHGRAWARTAMAAWLSENGQGLLPLVELIEQGQLVVDEFMGVLGRAALEAVLELSAAQVAGAPHQGKPGGAVRRHGKQRGSVQLCTQRVRVERPRLRHKHGGEGAEVAVPAYEAMQRDGSLGEQLCAILMSGVSTRHYQRVVPALAERCGVSRSAVSREFAAASAEQLRALCERRLDALELLVINLDGVRFGPHHVVAAIGVTADGRKHLLGLAEGATENATAATGLLEDLWPAASIRRHAGCS